MEPDVAWIEKFEDDDALYKDFYREKVENVSVYYLYVNRENELFHSKKDILSVDEGIVPRSQLVSILQGHRIHANKTYRPIALLKHNMDIGPDEVEKYMEDPDSFDFSSLQKNIDDIEWSDTITLFQSMNSLHIVFHEMWDSGNNTTRKIRIRSRKLNGRKTRRKQLKD